MPNNSKMRDTIEVIASYAQSEEKMRDVADRMGMPYSTLMRKLNPFDAYQINATEIIPLVRSSGNFSLVEHFNVRLNILAVPMKSDGHECLDMHAVARFAKESGEAIAAMSEALMDQKISAQEARQCKKELMELAQITWSMLKLLDEMPANKEGLVRLRDEANR